jgi:hypothetical protein
VPAGETVTDTVTATDSTGAIASASVLLNCN